MPKALTPFFTPTPESFWPRTVVGTRMCRMPRWVVAATKPIMSRKAPPPMPTTNAWRSIFSSTRRCCRLVTSAGSFFTCSPPATTSGRPTRSSEAGVHLGIFGYVVDQRRPARRDIGIHEDHDAMALVRLAAHDRLHEYRIVAPEQMLGEMHRVLVTNRKFLGVDRFHGFSGRFDQFDAHRSLCFLWFRSAAISYLNTTESARSAIACSPTRGVCPRSTELPSNSMRWSIGAGLSQCSSFIWPLWPNALSALP